jgi:hypothetical protein
MSPPGSPTDSESSNDRSAAACRKRAVTPGFELWISTFPQVRPDEQARSFAGSVISPTAIDVPNPSQSFSNPSHSSAATGCTSEAPQQFAMAAEQRRNPTDPLMVDCLRTSSHARLGRLEKAIPRGLNVCFISNPLGNEHLIGYAPMCALMRRRQFSMLREVFHETNNIRVGGINSDRSSARCRSD